jgi:hypothetical protein
VKAPRPGIASANRPRIGQFTSLLDQILHDDCALDGLAFAYSVLPSAERRALLEAVLQDAGEPTQPLMALLAVEEDPALRQRLAGLIGQHGQIDRWAFLDGDEVEGEARLTQSLPGSPTESLCLAWKQGKIHQIEIKTRNDSKNGAREVAIPEAVSTLVLLLWRHIRSGGAVPEGAERFAVFFSAP